MHSSGSFLLTVIERIRYYMDEAVLDAKYTNDYIVRHVVMPEMHNVWSRISRNYDNPVLLRTEITLASGTEYYLLPPNVHEVWRVSEGSFDPEVGIKRDARTRSEFSRQGGPNWSIEGNLLAIRPGRNIVSVSDNNSWTIWYTPSGDFLPHYATDGRIDPDDDNRKEFDISGWTPTGVIGQVDRRENAYAGGYLRILATTGGAARRWEEHVIDTYDVDGGVGGIPRITLRTAISGTDTTGITYEIVPPGITPLWQAIACSGAINLGTAKSTSQKKANLLVTEYRKNIKSVGDWMANMQARNFKSYDKDTIDNRGAITTLLR
jgi:hypothetical protein